MYEWKASESEGKGDERENWDDGDPVTITPFSLKERVVLLVLVVGPSYLSFYSLWQDKYVFLLFYYFIFSYAFCYFWIDKLYIICFAIF